jgi:large subunit ribosomal protein L21
MYAVIKTGGKQYRVKEGDIFDIEKIIADKGWKVVFDQVFLVESDGGVLIGTPVVENAAVKAEVVDQHKGDKVLIFKKKRRKQYRRTRGHRQELTKIRIEKIYPDTKVVPAEELETVVPAAAPVVPPAAKPAPKPAPKRAAKEPEKETPKEKKAKAPAAKKPAAAKAAPKSKAPAKPAATPKKKGKE